MSKEYIEKQKSHLESVGNHIAPMRPGVGFYTTVNGLEISETFFPEEYKQIQEAWSKVISKLEKIETESIKNG